MQEFAVGKIHTNLDLKDLNQVHQLGQKIWKKIPHFLGSLRDYSKIMISHNHILLQHKRLNTHLWI